MSPARRATTQCDYDYPCAGLYHDCPNDAYIPGLPVDEELCDEFTPVTDEGVPEYGRVPSSRRLQGSGREVVNRRRSPCIQHRRRSAGRRRGIPIHRRRAAATNEPTAAPTQDEPFHWIAGATCPIAVACDNLCPTPTPTGRRILGSTTKSPTSAPSTVCTKTVPCASLSTECTLSPLPTGDCEIMTTCTFLECPPDSQAPTEAPTEAPSEAPTVTPTEAPTETPTHAPTDVPTEAPSEAPTATPTEAPTETPTQAPITEAPTEAPTESPTEAPLSGCLSQSKCLVATFGACTATSQREVCLKWDSSRIGCAKAASNPFDAVCADQDGSPYAHLTTTDLFNAFAQRDSPTSGTITLEEWLEATDLIIVELEDVRGTVASTVFSFLSGKTRAEYPTVFTAAFNARAGADNKLDPTDFQNVLTDSALVLDANAIELIISSIGKGTAGQWPESSERCLTGDVGVDLSFGVLDGASCTSGTTPATYNDLDAPGPWTCNAANICLAGSVGEPQCEWTVTAIPACTDAPSDAPTEAPTDTPTEAPTETPTEAPTGTLGQSASNPALSCLDVLNNGTPIGDGLYWIDLPGGPYQMHCDFSSHTGGWTRVGVLDSSVQYCVSSGFVDLRTSPASGSGKVPDADVQQLMTQTPGSPKNVMFLVPSDGRFVWHALTSVSDFNTDSRHSSSTDYCSDWQCDDGSTDASSCGTEGSGCPITAHGDGGFKKKLYVDIPAAAHEGGLHTNGGMCGLPDYVKANAYVYVR
eukprot:TRINITY_DN1840_c0_g1_i5.p1 TRINITY_DN1840_c0_g1~~TRINITY_DN1840_c0_g1_i5.p1  ORF type:complete len:755 (-),score=94.27 TRINITY_DN1840_c0_g1_i5:276-2540(-)